MGKSYPASCQLEGTGMASQSLSSRSVRQNSVSRSAGRSACWNRQSPSRPSRYGESVRSAFRACWRSVYGMNVAWAGSEPTWKIPMLLFHSG